MNQLVSNLALKILDPLHIIRSLFIIPATLLGFHDLRQHERHIPDDEDDDDYDDGDDDDNDVGQSGPEDDDGSSQRRKSRNESPTARDIALKTTFITFVAAIIIWVSIFMYITFYYTYMPAIEHLRPVHIQYDACNHDIVSSSSCEFPHAFVPLTRRPNLLMLGQTYKVYLHLEMPETQRNRDLGMFMVCADMRDENTELLDHSCRTVMLHYKSSLVRAIRTWLLSPLYVFGVQEEKQRIVVELFPDYGEDQTRPVRDVFIEIQSRHVQLYTVTLQIVAHFTGLRYIMFHWPFVSAFVGISTNLFFILVISGLSWYHWGDTMWIERSMSQRLAGNRHKLQSLRRRRQTTTAAGDRSVSSMLDEDLRHQRDPFDNSIDSFDDNDNDLLNEDHSSMSEMEFYERDLRFRGATDTSRRPFDANSIVNVTGLGEDIETRRTTSC